MEVVKSDHYTEVKGFDEFGEISFRILNDCSQIQINTAFDDAYINVNHEELMIIRDAITQVLEKFDSNNS